MNFNQLIPYIEDDNFVLTNNVYYHAFQYKQEEFIDMITEGIKSPILLGRTGDGNNGNFYVSLVKKENCLNSIYNKLGNTPMFVINNKIIVFKTRNFKIFGSYPLFIRQSPLPFRESEYDDEYQKFLKVTPKDIIAIKYDIFMIFQKYHKNNEYIKNQLLILKQMIETMNSKKIYLPIIDTSTSKKINTEKVLSLKL